MVTLLSELAIRAGTGAKDLPTELDVALAAGATLVAIAFCLSTLDRWLRRRRAHELAWTIALMVFAVATAALWYGFSRGWSNASFRVFYLTGAILNVPWLALGTVYLVAGERVGRRVQTWLLWTSGLATGVMLAAPMKAEVNGTSLPQGRVVFGVFPRVLAAVGSGLAAVVIIAGALWSTWRFWKAGRTDRSLRMPTGRLVGSLIIAVGTIALSTAGSFSARLGESRAFTLVTAVGVAILFSGFLVANSSFRRTRR